MNFIDILDNNKIKIKLKKKVKRIKIKKKIENENKSIDKTNLKLNPSEKEINSDKLSVEEKSEKLNDFELSELNYEDALKKDKRTFIQLYISLIKRKHLFIFSFILQNDFNSLILKIFLFFFTFTIYLIINALFYSDSTMHKIYVDQGKFDFTYQLPQMIYSLLISTILKLLLNFLGLYEEEIFELKNNKKNKEKIFLKIKKKIIIFFILTYILLFLFWIYLGCFCYVYKNTQIHLLKDVISSFSISLITPFFVVLLPCFMRIYALKDKNGKRSVLYKISNIL